MSVYFSWLLFCLLPEWPGKFSLVQTSCHSCPRVWSMCFGKVIIYKSCAGLFSAEFQKQNLVPNPFDPRTSGPPLPVPMDKWSPNIWSPWTNGPQPIWSHWTNGPHQIWSDWTNGPQNLVPLDKWSPTNLVPIFPNHHSLSP